MTFGELVRAERIRRGLTLVTVAAACGTSKGHMSGYETGNEIPGPKMKAKIIAYYRFTPEQVKACDPFTSVRPAENPHTL